MPSLPLYDGRQGPAGTRDHRGGSKTDLKRQTGDHQRKAEGQDEGEQWQWGGEGTEKRKTRTFQPKVERGMYMRFERHPLFSVFCSSVALPLCLNPASSPLLSCLFICLAFLIASDQAPLEAGRACRSTKPCRSPGLLVLLAWSPGGHGTERNEPLPANGFYENEFQRCACPCYLSSEDRTATAHTGA